MPKVHLEQKYCMKTNHRPHHHDHRHDRSHYHIHSYRRHRHPRHHHRHHHHHHHRNCRRSRHPLEEKSSVKDSSELVVVRVRSSFHKVYDVLDDPNMLGVPLHLK